MTHLLILACLVSPVAGQAGDSLVLESPESRRVLQAADWAEQP